jgi:hypothetical protein
LRVASIHRKSGLRRMLTPFGDLGYNFQCRAGIARAQRVSHAQFRRYRGAAFRPE